MTTLIVQLPPRDPAVLASEWHLPELAFLLLDKRGRTLRAGCSTLALLPRANATWLLMAARDILMVSAKVPPLNGARLRQILPNVIEEQLIQDPQTCHVALDPEPLADGRRMVAVIDRGWFRFVHEAFTEAGHRHLRAVPLTRCLPAPPILDTAAVETGGAEEGLPVADAAAPGTAAIAALAPPTPVVALLIGPVVSIAPALLEPLLETGVPQLELALARGAHGEGLAVPADALAATLAALVGTAPLTLWRLTDTPGREPGFAARAEPVEPLAAEPLTFETLARRALTCKFDLCQFEFSAQTLKLGRDTLRRWRLPIVLVAATLLIAVIGANVQWLRLVQQRNAINTQMTELLLTAFPKTTVVLDPANQMTRQLEQLRVAAGELSPNDFLTLADGVARSLGPLPTNSIASFDYREHALVVTFKPDAKVNDTFAQRLARNGLEGSLDQDKWTIRSMP